MVARAVEAPLVIGVDVGGTKIRVGLIDREGNVLEAREESSPDASQAEFLAALDASVEELLSTGRRVAAIGFGVPSNLERGTGRVLRATNLPLADVDLVARARERFGVPVAIENDGNAATLAEWTLGAGRGSQTMVMLTLGTGVGGGLVLDGKLYRGWAELGHVVVQENGPVCGCGGRGHLEVLAAGTAADRVAGELYGEAGDSHLLLERAHAGEQAAVEAVARLGASLGAAVGSFANMFDPDVTVVGGGFGAAAGELVLSPAREAARREAMPPADEKLRLVAAELGAEAGLVGAGLVAFEALDGRRR